MKSRLLAFASVIVPIIILINQFYPVGITQPSPEVVPSSVPAADHGCTSFSLNNADHGVFGTNLDESFTEGYLSINQRQVSQTGYEPNPAGEYAHWISRYGSLTFNLVGYQLPWAGMNEAGLTVSTMWLAETKAPMQMQDLP